MFVCVCERLTPQESSTGVFTCLGGSKQVQKFSDYLDDDHHAEVAPAAGERSEYGEERAGGRSGRGGSFESGADARQRPAKLVQRRPARRTPTPEIRGDGRRGRGGVV